jgi:hypothetical protein
MPGAPTDDVRTLGAWQRSRVAADLRLFWRLIWPIFVSSARKDQRRAHPDLRECALEVR